jgi:hypothetical protein
MSLCTLTPELLTQPLYITELYSMEKSVKRLKLLMLIHSFTRKKDVKFDM